MAVGRGKLKPSDNPKPFKKGHSGNPAGRPKKIPAIDELLADILSEENDGLSAARQVIVALVKKAKSGDVRAAEVLFDRAYGKVKQRPPHPPQFAYTSGRECY